MDLYTGSEATSYQAMRTKAAIVPYKYNTYIQVCLQGVLKHG